MSYSYLWVTAIICVEYLVTQTIRNMYYVGTTPKRGILKTGLLPTKHNITGKYDTYMNTSLMIVTQLSSGSPFV